MGRILKTVAAVGAALTVGAAPAGAQSLGTFSWQLTPYCNVITVTVTQNGSNYTLDGYDNQCGASPRATVLGMAVPNPTGTVTLGFTIVTPPSAIPVHVQTAIDLGTLGGSWTDDQGHAGTFVFTPSGVGTGAPRPAALIGLPDNAVTSSKIADGAVGASDIDSTQVQRRVSTACTAGELMTGVNEDGTVVCQAVTSGAGGDITAVNAGTGLTGGGATGDVTLAIGTGGVTATHLANNAVNGFKVLDGSIGAADVDPTQVQARVTGACPAGQAMRTIAQTGAVTCEPVAGGGGDITAVVAGAGLTGGAASGDATLSVSFGGSGGAILAARSDHTHERAGTANTSVGDGALTALTSGQGNTAVGRSAMSATTTGIQNTSVGWFSLENNVTGLNNTALGISALRHNVDNQDNVAVGVRAAFNGGSRNTAVGYDAIRDSDPDGTTDNTAVGYRALRDANENDNTAVGSDALLLLNTGTLNVALGKGAIDALPSGNRNVALGSAALGLLSSGSSNLAVGDAAGFALLSGSHNVYLQHTGGVGEDGTIRIGNSTNQTRAFVAGIRGITTGQNNALNVVVDSAGQLGTVSSSRKTKFDIADLDMSVSSALQRLRPVQFRYKQAFADGSTPIQYGLIAEEVQDVLPELVALDEAGQPASVKYHVLPALLLAEVQRLAREVAVLQSELATLAAARR